MEIQREKTNVLQWHPAFYAGIQIEFEEERENLLFENEHQLGTKPKEIDVLIIKKETEKAIQKNIGRIFRKHNIIEYKSPTDYVSIDDFYRVYGYACFYKADTLKTNCIRIGEITISLVCYSYPTVLMKHLRQERHCTVKKTDAGIYEITGDIIPMQVILIRELSEKQNFWLRNLTNRINDTEAVEELLKQYGKHKEETLYKSVMDIIVRANREKFEEVKEMCDALMELMKDEMEELANEAQTKGMKEGIKEGIKEGKMELIRLKLKKGKQVSQIAEELESSVEEIMSLIRLMNCSKLQK